MLIAFALSTYFSALRYVTLRASRTTIHGLVFFFVSLVIKPTLRFALAAATGNNFPTMYIQCRCFAQLSDCVQLKPEMKVDLRHASAHDGDFDS